MDFLSPLMRIVLILITLFSISSASAFISKNPTIKSVDHQSICNKTFADPSERHSAVASESEICSKVGHQILEVKGGSAADAMIATVFCIGTVAMYHSGLAGGGFLISRDPCGSEFVIDFRERAPAAAHRDMFVNNVNGSLYGGLASAIPGELAGMWELHQRLGTLPWESLVQPAEQLARNGWIVNEDLESYMDRASLSKTGGFLVKDPQFAIDFAPNGTLVKKGDRITRQRYANLLADIAKEGPSALYEGKHAQEIVNALKVQGGIITMQDLKTYSVVPRDPIHFKYRGLLVSSAGIPASGAVVGQILSVMNGFQDIGDLSNRNESVHRIVEAMRFAYAIRGELGDPSYWPEAVEIEKMMLDMNSADHFRSQIGPHTKKPDMYFRAMHSSAENHGTSHIVTADSGGHTISLTTTINQLFGSKLVVPETGLIMNNQMNDFSIPGETNEFGFLPSEANFVEAGKRPMSSISPLILSRNDTGDLILAIGAAGGSRIPTSVVNTLWNFLDCQMDLNSSVRQSRFHDQLYPNQIQFESDFDQDVIESMRLRGHDVVLVEPNRSSVSTIHAIQNSRYDAMSDPRQKNSGAVFS